MTSPTTITCARCSKQYAVALSTWLPACPHCGRAATPLRSRIRDNRIAAVLCVLAAITLAIGFTQPFLTMEQLGERNTFSLVGGVMELLDRGYWIIGSVLFVFSIIFPVAKILALFIATSRAVPLSPKWRHRLHRAAELTGKYSMLDVLVVAVIIVLVKFNGLANAQAHSGTAWFCAAVLLSMLAGFSAKLPEHAPVATEQH